ncbi:MAG: DEAD/DEAH box helicase [Planctomycetota bacterium]|nr:DEAD/DEAH box helicase [Planctomycetota bacterium]
MSDESAATLAASAADRIRCAFAVHPSAGLLHLATVELQTSLPPSFGFARDLARDYLTRLCHTPGPDRDEVPAIAPPNTENLAFLVLQAPPMKGLEYLNAQVLSAWWSDLDQYVSKEIRNCPGGTQAYLRAKNPLWRLVGRVTFHLAENKRDETHPFAFMATYAHRLSAQARLQHLPLARALQEYAGAKNRDALLSLLTPIQRATVKSALANELVDSGDVYQALAWTPRDAYRFLKDIPVFEESGIIVRVPDWWKASRPPRPVVSVKVGDKEKARLGIGALLDFSVAVTLDGQPLTEDELRMLLALEGGLVPLRGRWVEVDREKLAEAIEHWKHVERQASQGGISFYEGMRLLSGANLGGDLAEAVSQEARAWSGIAAGDWLEKTLDELRNPQSLANDVPAEFQGQLRPYQRTGMNWLCFMMRLGLGACLADDMGLGKTIQVLAILLRERRERRSGNQSTPPSLLVVPASLIANWKAEIARFAPLLSVSVAHPSEEDAPMEDEPGMQATLSDRDLVITTYGMLSRMEWLRNRSWHLAILDEAQAIKNSGTRQTRAVKELKSSGRIALTGTPIENRLSDLWSLFDFLNPGLLGGAKAFARFAKELASREHNDYGPLRSLVRPYILRRMKTDKRIIADLPDKTEVNAYCALSKKQAALYEQSVRELAQSLKNADGIQRRGLILAYLMRLKQICNHPSQWLGDGEYGPEHSGKFERLRQICEELAQRQEKALVFTQFREIAAPLADYLQTIFERPGLILHGQTAVGKRRELVEAFQREDGPPFFVLSLRAGGTGLNLTAASHVIHFDRWWNPAVENQATDRAFRIGQQRNVLVHKFVCRGTVEEKIDQMIAEKSGLAKDLLEGGGEKLLTEMDNHELLRFVSLDIHRAIES